MDVLFVGTCPKEFDRPEANEDAFAFSTDGQHLAISDGASESFDSRSWANLLVKKWSTDQHFCQEWLASAIAEYISLQDFSRMSWSQQMAFERGCFATLLTVEHSPTDHKLSIFGIGDSVALLFVGTEVMAAWPLDDYRLFQNRPTLLSTLRTHNEFTKAEDFGSQTVHEIGLNNYPNPVLLCMTDALGEWTLRMSEEQPERLNQLLAIRSEEQLVEFVQQERDSKRMRVDDSTLAILTFEITGDEGGVSHP